VEEVPKTLQNLWNHIYSAGDRLLILPDELQMLIGRWSIPLFPCLNVDYRDFGRRKKSHGRAPCACTATDID